MTKIPAAQISTAGLKPTRAALVEGAAAQFNTVGYFGTDTNKIARAAGFAPQTFYRHFTDKMDIFLAVYEGWQAFEREALAFASRGANVERDIAKALLSHHRRWRVFRRSLRMLAVDDDQARRARAFSRERQLAGLAKLTTNSGRTRADLLASLLCVERLCDSAADGELADLGLNDKDALELVVAAVHASRAKP